MSDRRFVAINGRAWAVSLRPQVRKSEVGSHVTLEFASDLEIRVVSCLREEWETEEPDFAALLARSVASGASRHAAMPGDDHH
jgi:hypothetical protein